MTAPTLLWEDPPADGRTNAPVRARSEARDYRAIARELRSHPGRWARVAVCPGGSGGNVARRLRRGIAAGFRPAGAFEAESRLVDGLTYVYARYAAGGSP